jgi:hypothetical protein
MRIQVLSVASTIVLAFFVGLGAGTAFADEEPTPTPTPRPATGQTLTDIAKDTKLKTERGDTSKDSIVISNENLAEYASKGAVTEAKPGKNYQARGPNAAGIQMVDPATLEADRRKLYWQQMYVQQLSIVSSLERQIEQLDRDIPGLWNDFYARDDPAYRDGVIKPRLDQSLNRRDELEAQLAAERPKLQQIRENARRDGAEPGWFRELKLPTPPKE